jgi:peptidoglycan hydrolase-like protein with peptidoglycan-binding domain
VALAVAIVALLAGGTWVALSRASAQPGTGKATTAHQAVKKTHRPTAQPVNVVSVTPASHSHDVNGASPIQVVFSAPLAADSPMPTLSPAVAGNWQRVNATTVEFVPTVGFTQDTYVRVIIPAGTVGVRSTAGGLLTARFVDRFWTGSYSTMRLEQLLAELGYLPMSWQPIAGVQPITATDANGQLSAAYNPPQGTFAFQSGYPSQLQDFWSPGQTGVMLTGAVMAFENNQGMDMDGIAGPAVWRALLNAAAKGQDNPNGYTYAIADKGNPETLTIWHDGHEVLSTLANTGIPGRETVSGTFPVYLKYTFQIMKGTNPDGTKYADPVSWVSYFNGSDAVHYYPRGSYGWPQSLGCVELPLDQAKEAYPYLTYGSLVTVIGDAA